MSQNEKVKAMRLLLHPPSKHGTNMVKCWDAAEFKGIPIFCHRDNHHGNHVSLYYPGFADFTSMCESAELTKADYAFTTEICTAMSEYYSDEFARQAKCNDLLSQYFGTPVKPKTIQNPNASTITCDGAIDRIAYIEYKVEVGAGNCDSYTEVIAYYVEDLSIDNVSSCQPSFLIEIVGPHMFVSGAVFGERVYVDRLAPPIWLVVQPWNEVEMIRTAKTLKALKIACSALIQFLVGGHNIPQPQFPAIHEFGESRLEYVKEIHSHLFKCLLLPDNVNCVVKFTPTYSHDAHRLLANSGYAPKLLHDGIICNFHVVVMEEVENALTVDNYIAKNDEDRIRILAECRKALDILHSNGYCHGDFRPCNILVSPSKEIKVIDFDWAGQVDVATYPVFMNHFNITWPKGAEDGACLTKQHDEYWLEILAKTENRC